jgi:hypothetical protein
MNPSERIPGALLRGSEVHELVGRRIVVFVGPSAPREKTFPSEAIVPGPALRGALEALAEPSRTLVVLCDVAFFQRAAPTHVELKNFINRGGFLIGAASAGALRAAEFREPAVTGVGYVYDAVRAGLLTDDSELAVGMREDNSEPLTVSLIDVRRLLSLARSFGIQANVLQECFQIARDLYFLHRTPGRLVNAWRSADHETTTVLEHLMSHTAWRAKEADACEAVEVACACTRGTIAQGRRQHRQSLTEYFFWDP